MACASSYLYEGTLRSSYATGLISTGGTSHLNSKEGVDLIAENIKGLSITTHTGLRK